MNFQINLIFLIKPFFLLDQKVMIKTYISWERKELLRWNDKHSISFLKGFQWGKRRNFFRKVRLQLEIKITSCKAEQPLRVMELQEKAVQKG